MSTCLLKPSRWTSSSAGETIQIGKKIGANLSAGEILLLDGPLGAGKTVFVKGVAEALGIDPQEITSPSFTLVNLHLGRLRLYHIDLYRLSSGVAAAHAVDLEELLGDATAVIVIEWAERIQGYPLTANAWRVRICGDGEDERVIELTQDQ